MRAIDHQAKFVAMLCAVLTCLAACGGGGTTGSTSSGSYNVGGSVTGLLASGLIMENNFVDTRAVALGDTRYTMPQPLSKGQNYDVRLRELPTGQTCRIANSDGVMGMADVVDVAVTCGPRQADVSTVAGSGQPGAADGLAAAASFNFPAHVAADNNGNLYVSGGLNQTVRKIAPNGRVTTLAGSGVVGGFADGTGSAASFNRPRGLAVDAASNVYVADFMNQRIRKITPAGVVTTFAGSGVRGATDGTGTTATFAGPEGLAIDAAGNLIVSEDWNNKIRKITPDGVVTTLAGSGAKGHADGPGAQASFDVPSALAVDAAGNVYVADMYNNKIRKISPSGIVSTVAGSGAQGSADGIGTRASFYEPAGVALDSVGNVYVADISNQKIRKITTSGVVSTLTGSGHTGSRDGGDAVASFSFPAGLAADSLGRLYVADSRNHKVRKITLY